LAAPNLILIVLSTLGSGEHYLFDLLMAFPYTVAILYLGKIDWTQLFGTKKSNTCAAESAIVEV
jgi:hypothetical protein